MKIVRNTLVIITLVLFSTSAFAQSQNNNQFNDAEIAAIAVAANKIDIKYAKLAKDKSNNMSVLGFANTMINDHEAVIGQAVDLVTKLGVKPKENSLSKQLYNDSENVYSMLKSKKRDFDLAYINNEVEYHKAVINAVRNVLIPDTENEELKGLLTAILPALETHLEHAESIQNDLKN